MCVCNITATSEYLLVSDGYFWVISKVCARSRKDSESRFSIYAATYPDADEEKVDQKPVAVEKERTIRTEYRGHVTSRFKDPILDLPILISPPALTKRRFRFTIKTTHRTRWNVIIFPAPTSLRSYHISCFPWPSTAVENIRTSASSSEISGQRIILLSVSRGIAIVLVGL